MCGRRRCESWWRLDATRSKRSRRGITSDRSRCSARSLVRDVGPRSDLDLLVEFEAGTRPFELLSLGAELEDALGVPVDIGTRESLREGIRDEVLAEALPL